MRTKLLAIAALGGLLAGCPSLTPPGATQVDAAGTAMGWNCRS